MKPHQQHVGLKKQSGFTLIELLTTVIIIGVVLAIGVPSYQQFLRKNHTVTNANSLVTALNLARSEAVKRGAQVTIRRNAGATQVWENGWSIFTDLNRNGAFNDDGDATLCEPTEDCQLRVYGALPNNYTLRTGATYATWVAYLPNGLSRGSGGLANDTFRLCADDANITNSRNIAVSITGRPRASEGTTSCP